MIEFICFAGLFIAFAYGIYICISKTLKGSKAPLFILNAIIMKLNYGQPIKHLILYYLNNCLENKEENIFKGKIYFT